MSLAAVAPDRRVLDAFIRLCGARLWRERQAALGQRTLPGSFAGRGAQQRHALELVLGRLHAGKAEITQVEADLLAEQFSVFGRRRRREPGGGDIATRQTDRGEHGERREQQQQEGRNDANGGFLHFALALSTAVRSLGSSRSRRPSPMRLTLNTIRKISTPGIVDSQWFNCR